MDWTISVADTIASVGVVTVKAPLPVTIRFGPWVMKHREFALCRIRTEAGLEGFAFVYTRDGPIAAIVRRNIAPMYVGQDYDDPADAPLAGGVEQQRDPAEPGSGCGPCRSSISRRGTWRPGQPDSRSPPISVESVDRCPRRRSSGIRRPSRRPRWQAQVEALLEAGWRRFKQPIAATPDETRARLRAARAAIGPDCWLGMDCNWVFKQAQDAIDFARSIEDVGLGWMEDVVPPGNARMVAEIRRGCTGSDRDGRRAGRLVPSRIDPRPRRGRRRAHRRDDLRRHHPAARHASSRSRSAAIPFAPHMFAAHPLAGLLRRSVTRCRSSGASREPASTSSPTRFVSPWSGTA